METSVAGVVRSLKGYRLLAAGVLAITATLAILFLLLAPSNNSTISCLGSTYASSQLFDLILSSFGSNGVVLFLGAFFTLAAFFTAIPSSGAFSSYGPRIAGLFLIQQAMVKRLQEAHRQF
jgi:hypothetical protein